MKETLIHGDKHRSTDSGDDGSSPVNSPIKLRRPKNNNEVEVSDSSGFEMKPVRK